tara:strand:- start:18783 stop:18953 length:171 start_codon:yes stop_codon:yes gene_type:complete
MLILEISYDFETFLSFRSAILLMLNSFSITFAGNLIISIIAIIVLIMAINQFRALA